MRSTDFYINAVGGFFISDNLAVGTGVGYGHASYPQNFINSGTNRSTEYEQRSTIFSISPFGRYYVGVTPQIKFFGHLSASINSLTLKADIPAGEEARYTSGKSNFYSASLSPGIAIFPSKKIGIELSLSGFYFSKQKWKYPEVGETNYRTFGFGSDFFHPRLGMQFYL